MTIIINLAAILEVAAKNETNKELLSSVFHYTAKALNADAQITAKSEYKSLWLTEVSASSLVSKRNLYVQKASRMLLQLNSAGKEYGITCINKLINRTDYVQCFELISQFSNEMLEKTGRDLRDSVLGKDRT